MPDRPQPLLATSRRRRLSDEQTERRMLDAAAARVNEAGLTVSLEHISFEDVIREAGVSRSTVYRRWPYKDMFFSDLLKELARAATPAAVSNESSALVGIRQTILDHLDWLETPECRHDLILELLREGARRDFETMLRSTEWRTYLALHATFLGVDDEQLRAELRATLAASERDFISRIAASWERLVDLLGYRLRTELGVTYETIATLASADIRGVVLMSLADPAVGARRVTGRPFGGTQSAEWSLPAIAIASLAMAFLEPDPAVAWDEERIAGVRRTLVTGELAETPG